MVRSRRGRGEGSIFQRADGRWAAAIVVKVGPARLPKRKTVYGKTKTEVQQKLQALQADANAGRVSAGGKGTVAAYLTRWIETLEQSVRVTTLERYTVQVRAHMIPAIGTVELAKLSAQHIQDMLRDEKAAGASPRQVQMLHAVLHRALAEAVTLGVLPNNPCTAVRRPACPRRTMHVLSAEQARVLLKAAEGHRFELLFRMALSTGMREGELFGLHWADVDIRNGTLSVRHSLQEVSGRFTIAETKTSRGRHIVLDDTTAEMLRQHRAQSSSDSVMVFTGARGKFLSRGNFAKRVFRPLLQAAGLPRIRFHDLRHTAATLMLQSGIHPKIASERLGHSSISMTLDIYSHVAPTMQRAAADTIGGLLAPRPDEAGDSNAAAPSANATAQPAATPQ